MHATARCMASLFILVLAIAITGIGPFCVCSPSVALGPYGMSCRPVHMASTCPTLGLYVLLAYVYHISKVSKVYFAVTSYLSPFNCDYSKVLAGPSKRF